MKKILSFLFVLVLSCQAFAGQTGLLFVLSNAMEMYTFLPIINRCESEKIPFQVVTLGIASRITPDFSESVIRLDSELKSDDLLSQEDIDRICTLSEPHIVLSGASSKIQGQLLQAFHPIAKTVLFWEDGGLPGYTFPDFAKEIQKEADLILFSSQTAANALEAEGCLCGEKQIVGHPAFDTLREMVSSFDKNQIFEQLDCNPERMTLVYFGGQGPEYEKAYSLFLDYIKRLDDDYNHLFQSENERVNVLVQTDPKSDGSFEKEHSPTHFLIDRISFPEALAIADMVVSYDSRLGFVALIIGKDLFYFIPEGDLPTQEINKVLELGLAKRISSPQDFEQTINKSRIDMAERLGIPTGSVDTIFKFIRSSCTQEE